MKNEKCPVCGNTHLRSAGANPVQGTIWCNSCGSSWSLKEWSEIQAKSVEKVFSFDAETNGLWGQAFAIAAVLQGSDGSNIEFLGRCPIEGEINPWVKENVLPQMEGIPTNYSSYKKLLEAFMKFYMDNKEGATVIVHMGLPVESRLFIDAHNMGIIGDWDAPYPLVDISAFPHVGTSVDTYNKDHGLEGQIPSLTGGTHNPLYDSYAALVAYNYVKSHTAW